MADRITALRALLEKVEAGDALHVAWHDDAIPGKAETVRAAFHGSLDAAKALHEAVLPGWTWSGGQNAHYGDVFMFLRRVDSGQIVQEEHGAHDDNLARAWLIAQIKALISMEEEG